MLPDPPMILNPNGPSDFCNVIVYNQVETLSIINSLYALKIDPYLLNQWKRKSVIGKTGNSVLRERRLGDHLGEGTQICRRHRKLSL